MSQDKSKDKYCDYNNFKRTRYFHGMLMTDRDFREEQIYHNEKRKLLNRMLHGWGVVCGLGIKMSAPKSSKIIITPGMALDCHGNEIVVCDDFEVDLKKETICPENPEKEKDPCAETEKDGKENKYYIAIKYTETPTDPVPVYSPGGGCEEKVCDYSRTREGFCMRLFSEADYPPQPSQCLGMESLANRVYDCRKEENGEIDYPEKCLKDKAIAFKKDFCSKEVCCPDCCPSEHYVILGTVQYNAKTKEYEVNLNEGRQYVITIPFFKYMFTAFFDGTEKILKDVVDELKDVDVPDVNLLHKNPIAALCWLAEQAHEMYKKLEVSENSRQIEGMSKQKAEALLQEQGLTPVGTVTLTEANRRKLILHSSKVKELEEGDPVEIVVDAQDKPRFYIPAREKVELRTFKRKLNGTLKTIDELKSEIEKLKKEKKK